MQNQGLNPGEGASPDSFFPSFRLSVGQLTNRGNGKVCFMKTKASPTTNSVNRPPVRLAFLLLRLVLALAWFALAAQARAVCQRGCDTSNGNTFLGDDALVNNTTGSFNTAVGVQALLSNTTGISNTATGGSALISNTEGIGNTADGVSALFNNTTGSNNTATGVQALAANTTGFSNTATGLNALLSNTTGSENTATGLGALAANTTGSDNTATGLNTLLSDTTGGANTGDGQGALNANTTGSFNTATGHQALFNNTIGSGNIALGDGAGFNLTTGDNNIDIGQNVTGVAGEANTIRIGTQGTQTGTFIAGIAGAAINGRPVMINGNGRLGTAPCSARYKDEIKPIDAASEVILALKPVTFRYKKEIDADRTPQFGLIAEDVEKVNPALVARDDQGKPYTVRYEAVNAMLLNEFLKEHSKVEQLEKQVAALTAGLQKVTAQLELSKPATQTVLNDQ